jgi:hypothetical protein
LLTLLWLLTIAALLVALVAILQARRASRRLERVTESYWEIRYEVAQLRARLARMEPPPSAELADGPPAAPGAPGAFVPLSSLKRS